MIPFKRRSESVLSKEKGIVFVVLFTAVILCLPTSVGLLLTPSNIRGIDNSVVVHRNHQKITPIKPVVSLADTIIVDDDGAGDYTSIQDAIDNAATGDTIVVKDGTYGDALTVHTSVTLIAASGETPTIYVSTFAVGIDVTAPDVLIEGFEIFGNGSLTGGPFPTIRASVGANGLVVNANQFLVFTGERGQVALQVMGNVLNVTFSSNQITNYEIGVLFQPLSRASLTGNSFTAVGYPRYHSVRIGSNNLFYGSIQDAITQSSPGDTVTAEIGTFNENVVIPHSLTLQGLQSGFNPVGGRGGDETIVDGGTTYAITVDTGVTDVIIDGFTVTISSKTGADRAAGVLIRHNAEDVTVINNIIENITDGAGADTLADETYGVMVYGRDPAGGQANLTINNNVIRRVEEYGIAINDKTSNVTIQGNHISDLIASNHADFPDPSWPSWVCAAIHLGGQVGPIENVVIAYNTLQTNVIGDGSTTPAGGGISFAGVADWTNPSLVWEGFTGIMVTGNQIANNTMGIITLAGNFTDQPEVHDNNLSGNVAYGINNTVENVTFNATDNWWGDMFGPYHPTLNPGGGGVNVSDNVTFWPWYEFDSYSILPEVEYNVGFPQADDGYTISDTTEIQIIASDNETGLLSLTYRVWDTINRWSAWMPYTEKFTLEGEGKHLVEYNATDYAGTKMMETHIHYVDTVAPQVHVEYPNGGEFIRGPLTIQWEAADRILDQEQTEWNNYVPLSGDYPGHIQSFTPTEDKLQSISLLLHGDDANVTLILFSEIDPVPIPIAQRSQRLQTIGNENFPVWIEFAFNTEIDLNISKNYYIGVTQEIYGNEGLHWYYFDSTGDVDPYDYGHGWLKKTDTLESHPEWDYGFQTMFWETNVDITVEYSPTGVAPWSTIAEDESNDGSYTWDTSSYPDGETYRVRIIAEDDLSNMGGDVSDTTFIIDNTGPSISDITITDITVGSTSYTANGHDLEITATITGDPVSIEADLSGFGKGTAVPPTSYSGTTATWVVNAILCSPSDGEVTVMITARDPTGDMSGNTGSIIADNTAPSVDVVRPLPGIYFLDGMRLLPYPYPLVIGQITVEADADDAGSGIESVEFYLENKKRTTVTEAPYEWLWDEAALGFFTINIVAYDNVGHNATDEIGDIFVINLDIIGHTPPPPNATGEPQHNGQTVSTTKQSTHSIRLEQKSTDTILVDANRG